VSPEAERIVDHPVSAPDVAHTATKTAVAREILLGTDGEVLARGSLWQIETSRLGAGVVRLTLVAQEQGR